MKPRRGIHIFACCAAGWLLLTALALTGSGCGRGDAGEPPGQGARLAVLSPALAIILHDLGRDETLVGRHAFDRFSDASVPVVGDQHGVDYEQLLRARPTHILLERGASEPPARLLAFAEERAWQIIQLPMLTLDDIRAATRTIAGLTDAADRAAELLDEMDSAWSGAPGLRRRAGRTLALYWTNPAGAAGPGSFHHQLLGALGVEPIPAAGSAYIIIDPEDLRRMDPDTIVLFAPAAPADSLDDMLAPLARLDLRAVRNDRVVLVNHPWCQTPSTAMIEVAQELRRELEGLE